MDQKQIDELLWFPEAITKLTQKGIKDPIYKVLDIFKQDPSKSKQLQRHLERAIDEMINECSADEQAVLKTRIYQWLNGRITIKVYMAKLLPITEDDWSDMYDYPEMGAYVFDDAESAATKLFELVSEFKIKEQMYSLENCRRFVKQKAEREMHFYANNEIYVKYKVSIKHDHQFT